jgi:hypothetical protein
MSLDQEFESIKQFNKDSIDTLFIHLDNSNILDYRKNKKYKYGSEDHFAALKEKFISGREIKIEKEQLSEPDPALYFAIKTKLNIQDYEELKSIQKSHSLCMEMENIIGAILEDYIHSISNELNWIWCSGDIVRAIDFIKKNKDGSWEMLQIKNSDNSENSSSKKVRKGTAIKMWFRRFSKKKSFNWDELNKIMSTKKFSEQNFLDFLEIKLKS